MLRACFPALPDTSGKHSRSLPELQDDVQPKVLLPSASRLTSRVRQNAPELGESFQARRQIFLRSADCRNNKSGRHARGAASLWRSRRPSRRPDLLPRCVLYRSPLIQGNRLICRSVLYIGFSGLPIRSNRKSAELISMTQLEVGYRYNGSPGESAMRAVDNMREVYGIRRITFNSKDRSVRVEFDASRFNEPTIAALLRGAGVDIREKLVLA